MVKCPRVLLKQRLDANLSHLMKKNCSRNIWKLLSTFGAYRTQESCDGSNIQSTVGKDGPRGAQTSNHVAEQLRKKCPEREGEHVWGVGSSFWCFGENHRRAVQLRAGLESIAKVNLDQLVLVNLIFIPFIHNFTRFRLTSSSATAKRSESKSIPFDSLGTRMFLK